MNGRALLLAIPLILGGCGYHTRATGSGFPQVKTLAVPAFVNQTQTYRVEQALTAAVVRELTTRTHYQVINHPDSDADATLKGTVTSVQIAPITYDASTGRASSSLVTVQMKVSLVDRKGKVLFENPNYVYRDEYQISSQLSSFFEEESPTLDRIARDFSRSVVANILEGY